MQSLVKALAWSLVHSLWIGMAAALIAAMIISTTKRTKARLRYNLLGVVYILFLLGVALTFILNYQPQPAAVAIPDELVASIGDSGNSAVIAQSGGFANEMTNWFNSNANMLLLVWSLFFCVNCLKIVTGLASVNRLRYYKTSPVNTEWNTKLNELKNKLRIDRTVQLLQSGLVKVPVALGILKPVILIPVGLLANIPPEQVEVILLHELSHIRRKDYLVNLVQHFADAVFFFNPAILWISSLLRQEREACCDDIVLAETGEKTNYLNALVSFQEYSLVHNSYAMGMSSRRNYLLNRVRRIVTNENKKLNLFEKAALLSGIVLFSAFTFISNEKESRKIPDSISIAKRINMAGATDILTDRIPIKRPAKANSTSNRNIRNNPEWSIKPGSEWNVTSISEWNIANDRGNWVNDTVPKKQPVTTNKISDKNRVTSPRKNSKDDGMNPANVLADIDQIKKKIGAKKESIGVKKEQLKSVEGKNAEKEKEIKAAIEKERDEIEDQRDELEKKREILQNLKDKKEQENARDKEIENENKKRKEDLKNGKGNGDSKDKNGKGNGYGNDKGDGKGNGEGNDKGDGKGNGEGNDKGDGNDDDKSGITIRKVTPATFSANLKRAEIHSFNAELRNKLFNSRRDTRLFEKQRTSIESKSIQPPGVKEKPGTPNTPKVKTAPARQI